MNTAPAGQTLFVVKNPVSACPQLVATAFTMAAHSQKRAPSVEMPSRTKSGIFFQRFKRAVSTSAASKVEASGTSTISSRPTTPTTPTSGETRDGFGPMRRSSSSSSAVSHGLGAGTAVPEADSKRPGTSAGYFGFGKKTQPPAAPATATVDESESHAPVSQSVAEEPAPAPAASQKAGEPVDPSQAELPAAQPQGAEAAGDEGTQPAQPAGAPEMAELAKVNGVALHVAEVGGEDTSHGAQEGEGFIPAATATQNDDEAPELCAEPSAEAPVAPVAPAAEPQVPGKRAEIRATPPADADKVITYHTDVDLYLVLRNQAPGQITAYGVCSTVLAAAAPAWRRLLRETGTPVPDAMINFFHPHNTPVGLDILLSIAHYKFHELPGATAMPLDHLYQLSLAAARYEALHLLVPFMRTWLSEASTGLQAAGAVQGAEADKMLVLSWVFGCGSWFAKVAPEVVWNTSLSHDGQLVDSRGKLWKEQPVSEAVLDLLASARSRFVAEVVTAVSTPLQKLLNPQWFPDQDVRFCRSPDESGREDCEQLQLGSALMGLTKAKLWPAPDPTRIKASPAALARAYNEVRIRRYRAPALRFSQMDDDDVADEHSRCGFGHRETFETTRAGPVAMDAVIVKEMEMHAKACGTWALDMFAGMGDQVKADLASDELKADTDADHYKRVDVKAEHHKNAVAHKTGRVSAAGDRSEGESVPSASPAPPVGPSVDANASASAADGTAPSAVVDEEQTGHQA